MVEIKKFLLRIFGLQLGSVGMLRHFIQNLSLTNLFCLSIIWQCLGANVDIHKTYEFYHKKIQWPLPKTILETNIKTLQIWNYYYVLHTCAK